jgi:hypothetical protein
MKRFLFLLLIACAFVGCSSPDKAKPAIQKYLMEQISKPETYNAGVVELVSKGTIDVSETKYWKNIPENGRIDVVLLRHEFNYENHFGMNMDNAYYFYMNPKMDVIYYAHPDTGVPLFKLDE